MQAPIAFVVKFVICSFASDNVCAVTKSIRGVSVNAFAFFAHASSMVTLIIRHLFHVNKWRNVQKKFNRALPISIISRMGQTYDQLRSDSKKRKIIGIFVPSHQSSTE